MLDLGMVAGMEGVWGQWLGTRVEQRWVIVWVALGASTWKGMKVGWKQVNICDGVAFGLAATLVDDSFVGADPALDGVGVFLEEDFERFGEYI
jgi:hypothetical protein